MRLPVIFLAASASLLAGACTTTDDGLAQRTLVAPLATAGGSVTGAATALQRPDGRVEMVVTVFGMTPGKHGVHVHTTGACAPNFAAAGGHWNPDNMAHGLSDPAGQHAGDMPNIEVKADGTGTLTYTLAQGATLAGMLDADGSAFIVHAGEDDQRTDPAGNSGDRVACGVFAAR